MGKFDYPNYGEERCDCYNLFERQHDVIGKGLGFGVKKIVIYVSVSICAKCQRS